MRRFFRSIQYPNLPKGFAPACAEFEALLSIILTRGLPSPGLALQSLAAELEDPSIAQCFVSWVVEFEFHALISEAVHAAACSASLRAELWPLDGAQELDLFGELSRTSIRAATDLLSELSADEAANLEQTAAVGLPVDPRAVAGQRPQGRPRDRMFDYYCLNVLRQLLFRRTRSLRGAAGRALALVPAPISRTALYGRVQRLADSSTPIPRGWRRSLLAQRIEALFARCPFGGRLAPKALPELWANALSHRPLPTQQQQQQDPFRFTKRKRRFNSSSHARVMESVQNQMHARTLRVHLGLTLDELGRRTGIDRSRLSRFERGYGKLKAAELERLAAVLGTSADALAPPLAETAT
jgi:DNA-binding Xre family transcriptional regulator